MASIWSPLSKHIARRNFVANNRIIKIIQYLQLFVVACGQNFINRQLIYPTLP